MIKQWKKISWFLIRRFWIYYCLCAKSIERLNIVGTTHQCFIYSLIFLLYHPYQIIMRASFYNASRKKAPWDKSIILKIHTLIKIDRIQGVPWNLTHFVFGLLWIIRLSNFPMRPFILKLMHWGQKLVLIVSWDINRTKDIIKTNSRSKLFKIIRKDLYQVLLGYASSNSRK